MADEKIRAMEAFKSHPDFQPLAIAFKRVVNIIRGFQNGAVDPALFSGPEEKNLHEAFLKIRETVLTHISRRGLFRRSRRTGAAPGTGGCLFRGGSGDGGG